MTRRKRRRQRTQVGLTGVGMLVLTLVVVVLFARLMPRPRAGPEPLDFPTVAPSIGTEVGAAEPSAMPAETLTPMPTATRPPPGAAPVGTPGFVVNQVVDGDTIHVKRGSREDIVRLIGIDSPETGLGNRPLECYGHEASDYARRVLAGQPVSLELDPSQDRRDRYQRLLAYVWLADGTLFNEQAIAAGIANEYTYDRPYKYRDRFRAAEEAARAAGRGMWAPGVCR